MVYVYQPTNPLQSFADGFQAVTGMQDRRAVLQQEAADQDAQASRQMQLQDAVQNLRANPSPQAIADFGLQFPEMAKPMQEYFGTLAEASKQTEVAAMTDALIAERTGGDVSAVYARYAEAAENSRDPAAAKKFRDAAEFAKANPEAAAQVTKMRLAFADGDVYERVYSGGDPTAFQKDFAFIRDQFGEDAATEFAQFGRDGAPVSIPLGNGQTYVGPASMAPGASRWQMQGQSADAPSEEPPRVLQKALEAKSITPEEAAIVRKSLGPAGQKKFEDWMASNKIVISRTVNGQTYYQVGGKWYDNPEGR